MLQIGIQRSRRNRMFLGVCGGLAEHLGVSSKLVRLATLLAAIIVPGVSIWMVLIVYFALGLLLPQENA